MGRIVGIGGRLAAGKDTVADYLVGKGWVKFGMSDPLHQSMLKLNPIVYTYIDHYEDGTPLAAEVTYRDATENEGYTSAKDTFGEYRRVLQVFGTEVGRDLFGENVWSDIMKRRAEAAAEGGHDVIVTGIRFPNEVTAIHELGGELWWVDRGTEAADGHASENSVTEDDFDVVLPNTGTIEDLHRVVEAYV